jgi:hypothetical protein
VQATKTMETFLTRISKLTASMPDSALPVPVDAPRSITPSHAPSSENFALTAGTMIAGWAMSGLKKQVLGNEPVPNGIRSESAPPRAQFGKQPDTPSELKGLGSEGDVNAWRDEEFDDDVWNKKPQRPKQTGNAGMKLHVKSKNRIAEKVVEEENSKAIEDEEGDNVTDVGAWGLEDWDDDAAQDDNWGFDD